MVQSSGFPDQPSRDAGFLLKGEGFACKGGSLPGGGVFPHESSLDEVHPVVLDPGGRTCDRLSEREAPCAVRLGGLPAGQPGQRAGEGEREEHDGLRDGGGPGAAGDPDLRGQTGKREECIWMNLSFIRGQVGMDALSTYSAFVDFEAALWDDWRMDFKERWNISLDVSCIRKI